MRDRDRNLLFGVLAAQLQRVNPQQLSIAAALWASDPAKSLGRHLLEIGALDERDRTFLEDVVARAIADHGGDAATTLVRFGGEELVEFSFQGSIELTKSGGVRTIKRTVPGVLSQEHYIDPKSVPAVHESPGRYTQMSEHGRGGMGRVLLVQDAFLGRQVALKELLPGLNEGSTPTTSGGKYIQYLARFLQEARITGQLEHPSIVPVYELGHRNDGTLYYTMKLVRGKTLREALAETRNLRERLALLPHIIDLCQAIAYAHNRRVIHRDIKPSNIMVGEFGETVVLDWGLAKNLDREDAHADGLSETLGLANTGDLAGAEATAYGQIIGTPTYMPPEQAEGLIEQIDERSDIYSLGAVLYEILTGEPPFSGKSTLEVLKKVLEERPASVKTLEPDAPAELAAICNRAHARDRQTRYQTASELAQDLQHFQSGALVGAYTYTWRDLVSRFLVRHKAISTITAAATVFTLVFAGWSYWQINSERTQAIIARDAAIAAQTDAQVARDAEIEARQVAERRIEELRLATYASAIRSVENHIQRGEIEVARERLLDMPEDLRGWEWGNLLASLDRSSLHVFHPDAEITSVAYSPDGQWFATASTDRTVRVWDATTGNLAQTLRGHTDTVNSVAYNSDGRRLVTASNDETAKVWDSITGDPILTLSGHAYSVNRAEFSPDGNRIVTASRDRTARQWDAHTGEIINRLVRERDPDSSATTINYAGRPALEDISHHSTVVSAAYSPDGQKIVTASQGISIWDSESGQLITTDDGTARGLNVGFLDFRTRATTAQFHPTEEMILSGHTDGSARVWDLNTREQLMVLWGHESVVQTARFNVDGTRILTASTAGTIVLWNAHTAREINRISSYQDNMNAATLSPDAPAVVTGARDGGARLWRFRQGVEALRIDNEGGRIRQISPVPNTTHMMAVSQRDIVFWDVFTGQKIRQIPLPQLQNVEASLSPDGSHILLMSEVVTILDAETGTQLGVLSQPGHSPDKLTAFGPNGTKATISPHPNPKFEVLHRTDNTRRFTGELPSGTARGVWYSPDGTRLFVASTDGAVHAWNPNKGNHLYELAEHEDAVLGIAFSPDSTQCATTSLDGTTKIWSVDTGEHLLSISEGSGPIWHSAYDSSGTKLITGAEDGSATVWNTATGRQIHQLKWHNARIVHTSFSPDDKHMITVSHDRSLIVWNAETGQGKHRITGIARPGFVVDRVEYSHDGSRLRAVLTELSVRSNIPHDLPSVRQDDVQEVLIIDVESGLEVRQYSQRIPSPVSTALAYSQDGSQLFVAYGDSTAVVWDVQSQTQIFSFWAKYAPFVSAEYSPDSTELLTCDQIDSIRVLSAEDGRELRVLRTGWDAAIQYAGGVIEPQVLLEAKNNSAAYSPEGNRVLARVTNDTTEVLDSTTGNILYTLTGHSGEIRSAAFNRDGTRIITTSADQTARVWHSETGQELRILDEHDAEVLCGSFVSDGYRLVTGSADSTIRVWNAAPWQGDAWSTEAGRAELIELALRQQPDTSVIGAFHLAQVCAWIDMIESWEVLPETAPDAIREVPGQGILILDSSRVPALDGLEFGDGDMIVRIEGQRIDNLSRFVEIALSKLPPRGSLVPPASQLEFDVVNIHSFSTVVFRTPPVQSQETHLQRSEAMAIFHEMEKYTNRLGIEGGNRPYLEGTWNMAFFMRYFELEGNLTVSTIGAMLITGTESMRETVRSMRRRLSLNGSSGERLKQFDMLLFQRRREHWIDLTVYVDDEVIVPEPTAVEVEDGFILVPAGEFEMGRPYEDSGEEDEVPVHRVYLDDYIIGKYLVTAREFVDALNWADSQGFLRNSDGNPYDGGVIHAHGQPIGLWGYIEYRDGEFVVGRREGARSASGDEISTMADHPAFGISWYVGLVYCNWRSQMEGLEPVYDLTTWERRSPIPNGYRLPTEAEWERAAAWDGISHWRFPFFGENISIWHANYHHNHHPVSNRFGDGVSPVGWYNGQNPVNVEHPRILTRDSRSPVGAYDMAGNVWEWCEDWYDSQEYQRRSVSGVAFNPSGPETGDKRVLRGGARTSGFSEERDDIHRSASRSASSPDDGQITRGIRVVSSP